MRPASLPGGDKQFAEFAVVGAVYGSAHAGPWRDDGQRKLILFSDYPKKRNLFTSSSFYVAPLPLFAVARELEDRAHRADSSQIQILSTKAKSVLGVLAGFVQVKLTAY